MARPFLSISMEGQLPSVMGPPNPGSPGIGKGICAIVAAHGPMISTANAPAIAKRVTIFGIVDLLFLSRGDEAVRLVAMQSQIRRMSAPRWPSPGHSKHFGSR